MFNTIITGLIGLSLVMGFISVHDIRQDNLAEESLGLAISLPYQGGTGTSTKPSADQILIGGDTANKYDVKTLTAGTNITIATSSGAITISGTGGGGGGGSGTVSTSTSETAGGVPYWTSTSGTPALLGEIATTTLSGGTGITVTGTLGVLLGGTNSTLTLDATGDWTGTFDGQEGSYYLDADNLTNFGNQFFTFFNATTTDALSEGSTNFYYTEARFNSSANASTTIGHNLVTVTDSTTVDLTLAGQDITADGLYTGGTNLTLTGSDFAVDDAFLINDGDDTTTGNLTVVQDIITGTKNLTDYAGFYNGTFKESFNATTTSNGTVITLTIADSATYTGGLTMRFSDGDTTLTTATTTILTAGSDTSPTENFVYILQSNKDNIVVTTTDWGGLTEEHIKIGYFLCPSATFVQTEGCYVNQNWNDHATNGDNQGHLSHIGERDRFSGAVYHSGIDANGTDGYLTPTASNVEFKSTSGIVYQAHGHTIPAYDTSTGDVVLVKNWSGDSYHNITNLFDIVNDSTGSSIGNNKYFNLTVWAVANKTGQFDPVMINLPSGSYNSQSTAENDTSGFDDLTIPAEFKTQSSTGVLIARLTIQMGTTWDVVSTVDLRGLSPQAASGGTASGNLVNFIDNTFTIEDESDATKILAFEVSGVTTGNTRTLTVPDANGTMALTADLHSAVTMSGTPDYITLSGQDIVRGIVDIGDDTNLAGTANQITLTGDTLSLASPLTLPTGTTTATNVHVTGDLQVDGVLFAPVTITSTGNLNVGGDLVVTGSNTATHFIANSASATSTFAGGLTVDTSKFFVDPDAGRVGVGTAAPEALIFEMAGAAVGGSPNASGDDVIIRGYNVGLSFLSPNTNQQTVLFGDADDNDIGGFFYTHSTDAMTLRTNGIQSVLMDSTNSMTLANGELIVQGTGDSSFVGNVGIGTTSPSDVLSVTGDVSFSEGTNYRNFYWDATNGYLGIGTTSPNQQLTIQGTGSKIAVTRNNGDHANRPAGTEFQRSRGTVQVPTIVQDGDVIGSFAMRGYDGALYTQAAGFQVKVDGTPGTNDMPGLLEFLTTADGASSWSTRLTIEEDGDFLMNSTTAAVGSDPLCWDSSGASYWGDCSSLLKWKTNLNKLDVGLKEVLQLEPYSFDWKYKDNAVTDGEEYDELIFDQGFIADYVEEVNPLLVDYNQEGELTDINERAIMGAIINAIQDLFTKHNDDTEMLLSRIEALEKKIESLESPNQCTI